MNKLSESSFIKGREAFILLAVVQAVSIVVFSLTLGDTFNYSSLLRSSGISHNSDGLMFFRFSVSFISSFFVSIPVLILIRYRVMFGGQPMSSVLYTLFWFYLVTMILVDSLYQINGEALISFSDLFKP